MLRSVHLLQLTALGMLGLAVVMVHSAGMNMGTTTGPLAILFSRHTVHALLAAGILFGVSRMEVRKYLVRDDLFNPLIWALVVALVLVGLVLVPGIGQKINGARRWLRIGPFTMQPSELVKWVLVVAIAWWCARRGPSMKRFGSGLLPVLVLVAVACGLIVIEDLGTALLIAVVAACLLLAGGARWWHLALVLPLAAVPVVIAIVKSPYRLARITAYLDPWADPRGIGYHAIQSQLAIAQGGLLGRGLGNGIQKFGYVPADTTDFIFAVICEELGILGAMMVVAAYLAILGAGLCICRDCKDTFGRLIVLGVVLTVGFQAVLNLAVVTVVVPTKGIALPLISAGGSGWVLTAFALGLVVAMDKKDKSAEVIGSAQTI